jgi:hypothetical protein
MSNAKIQQHGQEYFFWCPACKMVHAITNKWQFNGDFNAPTFSPSILVQGVQRITDEEAARILNGENIEPRPLRCHSYIENGYIRFCDDSLHDLKGQTLALEPVECKLR